jgi:cephalosporin hydroxylase
MPDLPALADEAVRLFQNGRFDDALRTADQIARTRATTPGLHGFRARCLASLCRYPEALEAIGAELQAFPDNAEARAEEASLRKVAEDFRRSADGERTWFSSLPREMMLHIELATERYTYRGVPMIKSPFDFALYPLLIFNQKPRTIFEIGSLRGGSALWMADMLENFGIDGHVYSIDLIPVTDVSHRRATFLRGNGRELGDVLSAEMLATLPHPFLVIEDADHSQETTYRVLEFFHPFLAPAEYFVVEDAMSCEGPRLGLEQFSAFHPGEYLIDSRYCDFYGYNVTWCKNGFLCKLGSAS